MIGGSPVFVANRTTEQINGEGSPISELLLLPDT